MSSVALNLFERRFSDLVKIGRAKLPAAAPDWTDHNAHDPGITLVELLAWVGEAQLYSLSKLRRDERRSYAALLGIEPSGTTGATGLIWPDRTDAQSPAATFMTTVVIPADAAIEVAGGGGPVFRPTHPLLWSPCTIASLITRNADGQIADHTRTNQRGTLAYLPFGERATRRDVLVASFICRDDTGLLGNDRRRSAGALWSIGVLAAPPGGGATVDSTVPAPRRSVLRATLVADGNRTRVPIVSDTTQGMLATGTILLDVSALAVSPTRFAIEFASTAGFPRPPRVLRIEPNVIPIRQGSVIHESHEPTGLPDWSFALEQPGLRFAEGEPPVVITVAESDESTDWTPGRLNEQGPAATVYEFDVRTGTVTFGNGVNGAIPPRRSTVLVTYAVCDGARGETARNRKWQVQGFPGAYGVNPDPITGGALPAGSIEQRRTARERSRVDHALISADDIVNAATRLPLLEVARAWVVPPAASSARTGTVTLVVMRSRPNGVEPEFVPETSRWLAAIHRQLVRRMPLGTRLSVTAPRYAAFSIHAAVESAVGRKPADVKKAITETLARRLALVELSRGIVPREPGVPVTTRDVRAWIRSADGVNGITELRLRDGGGREISEVRVGATGLPKWSAGRSEIEVSRPKPGSPR
jgi:hypothetical protein